MCAVIADTSGGHSHNVQHYVAKEKTMTDAHDDGVDKAIANLAATLYSWKNGWLPDAKLSDLIRKYIAPVIEAKDKRIAKLEDDRDKWKARFECTADSLSAAIDDYNDVKAQLAAVTADRDRLREGLNAVQGLIDESYGVAGLHMNEEVAPWDSLL